MKKKLIFTAAALAMLASCSQNDLEAPVVAQSQQGDAIEFGTYVAGSATSRVTTGGKPGEMTDATLKTTDEGFGVFAYNTMSTAWESAKTSATPNFMYNEQIKWNSTKWEYSPLKYWPNEFVGGAVDNQDPAASGASANGKVSFFAYAPYAGTATQDATPTNDATITGATTGITKVTGNAKTGAPEVYYIYNKDNPVDLLWGTRPTSTTYNQAAGTDGGAANTVNIDLVKQKTGETVKFLFKHVLSAIAGTGALSAVVNPSNGSLSNTKVSITSVTISDGGTANVKNAGRLNLETGTFTIDDAVSAAEVAGIAKTYATADILDEYAEASPTLNDWSTVKGISDIAEHQILKDNKTPIIFMPGSTPKLSVNIVYTVRTQDTKLASGWSESVQNITKVITFGNDVVSGKRYKLKMILGLEDVDFEATVDDWSDIESTAVEVNLPINVTPAP